VLQEILLKTTLMLVLTVQLHQVSDLHLPVVAEVQVIQVILQQEILEVQAVAVVTVQVAAVQVINHL
jgi:hypothetical protein